MERTESMHQSFILSPEDVLLSIESDPFLSPFCKENFDRVAFAGGIVSTCAGGISTPLVATVGDDATDQEVGHASRVPEQKQIVDKTAVLMEKNIEGTCDALEVATHRLDVAIRRHVLANEDALLGSMKGVNGMSGRCKELKGGICDLQRNINRLKRIPEEQLATACSHLREMKQLQEASHCLKQLQRMLSALRRLKQQEGVILDQGESCRVISISGLVSAAQSLMELEEVIADPSMAGITLAEEERHHVRIVGTSIRRFSAENLAKGLNAMSRPQIASALEVFHNLACLPEQTKACISRLINHVDTQVSEVLQELRLTVGNGSGSIPTTPRKGKGLNAPATPQKQQGVECSSCRKYSETIMEAIENGYKRAELLFMVLMEQTDTISHTCYFNIVSSNKHFSETPLPDAFWLGLFSMLRKNLQIALDVGQESTTPASGSATTGSLEADSGRSSLSRPTLSPQECSPLSAVYPHLYNGLCSMVSRIAETTKPIGQEAAAKIEAEKHADPFGWSRMLGGCGILGRGGAVDIASQSFTSTKLEAVGEKGFPAIVESYSREYSSSSTHTGTTQYSSSASKDVLINSLNMMGTLPFNEALDPLKDQYFSALCARLTTPVEYMFPQSEGYTSAVPSKHDLNSFLKAIADEFSIVEGNPRMVQLTFQGVTSAVDLFLKRAGELVSTKPSAFRVRQQPNQPRPWVPSSEQKHNHLVLVLLGRLRDGLSELLMSMGKSFKAFPHEGAMLPVNEVLSMCNDSMAATIEELDTLAKKKILSPLLVGVSTAAEETVANLHADNFGRGAEDADMGSMLTIEDCISGIWQEHLKPIQVIGVPFAIDGVRAFFERIIRVFVSHAALIQPLKDAGKRKLAHYLARFEALLSQFIKVSSLGDSFTELRGFRQLIFLESPELPNRSPPFLREECLNNIRPSSALHYICSLCPDMLSSPHVERHDTKAGTVNWLLNGGASDEWRSGHRKSSTSTCYDITTGNEWPGLIPDTSYEAESQAWANLRRAIDLYQQRQSVSRKNVSSNKSHQEEYPSVVLLIMAGPQLLSSYAARLEIDKKKKKK